MPHAQRSSIVVVGSLNVDLVVRTQHIPQPGETITGTSFARYSGGKGANQAVAAAKLGSHVSLIGRVGDDLFGADQLQSLQGYGVHTQAIFRTVGAPTGTAVITVEEVSGQNHIVIVPGANGCLTPSDVQECQSLFATAGIVVAQLESPLPVVEAVAKLTKAHGAMFMLNPAPAQALPPALLAQVDVLTPNEHEAEQLTGIAVNDMAGVRAAAARLRDMGVTSVIITLGGRGIYCLSDDGEFMLPAHQVSVVDTVAAGDAFTGALAVALTEGLPLAEAAAFANAAAAVSVTRQGAQSSLPTREEVHALLAGAK